MSQLDIVLSALKKVVKSGDGYMALCPVEQHKDKNRSLSVTEKEGLPLLHCFGGCSQQAVIDALKEKGAWPRTRSILAGIPRPTPAPSEAPSGGNGRWLQELVQRTLREAFPLNDPRAWPGRLYLERRGLDITKLPGPDACMFHHRLLYKDSEGRKSFHPGLVCPITRANGIIGVLRIYLDCRGGKAKLDQPKKVLGKVKHGTVKLDPEAEVVAVTEGLETGLAVREATGLATLVAVSAGNLEYIELSDRVREVHIFGDCDESGAGQEAAEKTSRRLRRKGLISFVHIPEPENG